jgi:hypothetical protein
MLLFDGLARLFRLEAAKSGFDYQARMEENACRTMMEAVAYAYNTVLLAKENRRIALTDKEFQLSSLENTRHKFNAGAAPLSDVLNFEIYVKSAEVSLSPNNYDYGKWAGEIIGQLGFEKISCFAGSFGAGIIAKTMCIVPDKIKKAVLYIPSGINNAPAINSINMMFPMIMYWTTHKDKWLKKCILPMAINEENITDDIYETAKLSIDFSKVKTGMPSNVKAKDIKKCDAPTLIMAAEKDCLFPAKKVIPRAKKIIPNCTTYLLEKRGHMHFLTEDEKKMIVDFLL